MMLREGRMRHIGFIISCLLISIQVFCEEKPKLTDYKRNVYSQFGEDGIIEKIFEIIGPASKIAIEFGATEGFFCSNTANLWTKGTGWKGILIEANKSYFDQLVTNVAPYPCIPIHQMIGVDASDSLEATLKNAGIGDTQVDFLSIDIDGNDYYVLKSLDSLHPRLISCEYNVSIPAHLDVYPQYNNYIGCSVAALERIAAEKGYTLIALTDTNCFFLVNEELHKFADFDIDREHLKITKYTFHVISDYSGKHLIIAESGFTNAWGWAGASSESCNGDIVVVPGTIIRN